MKGSPLMQVRKTQKGAALKRWFKEDWRTPSGKKGYEGGENTFRPTKKISSKLTTRFPTQLRHPRPTIGIQ